MLVLGLAGWVMVAATFLLQHWAAVAAGLILGGAATAVVLLRRWISWRSLSIGAAFAVGLLLLSIGALYLWRGDLGVYPLAQNRFVSLAGDNEIPGIFAQRLWDGIGTHGIMANWNGSDRPPLQSGLLLLLTPFGLSGSAALWPGAQMAAQLFWIPAMWALLQSFRTSRSATIIAIAVTAVAATTVTNTTFTWPKLLSAGLVLASAAFLVEARRARFVTLFIAAVAAFGLAALAHGGAVFALPLLVWLGLLAWRGHRPLEVVRAVGWSVLAGAVLYVPWMLYQRFVDPPGDGLLRLHLAGQGPDGTAPLFDVIVDAYRSITLGQWWDGRLRNLGNALNPLVPVDQSASGFWFGPSVNPLRDEMWGHSSTALGIALLVLIGVAIAVVVRWVRARRLRDEDRPFAIVIAGSLACILLWSLVLFAPGSTFVHQGSHVWILLGIAMPVAWLAERTRWIAAALVPAQLALTLVVEWDDNMRTHTELSISGFSALLAGILIIFAAVLIVMRSDSARRVAA